MAIPPGGLPTAPFPPVSTPSGLALTGPPGPNRTTLTPRRAAKAAERQAQAAAAAAAAAASGGRLKRLTNTDNVYTMMKTAEGDKFKCRSCHRCFNLKCTLLRHVRHQHQGRYVPHPCPQCGQIFKRTDHLKVHLRKIHNIVSAKRAGRGGGAAAAGSAAGGAAAAGAADGDDAMNLSAAEGSDSPVGSDLEEGDEEEEELEEGIQDDEDLADEEAAAVEQENQA